MMSFDRKHKCRSCGASVRKKLPGKFKDPRHQQLARVWLRLWLKLRDEQCARCFARDASAERITQMHDFETASGSLDEDGIMQGLQYAAENIPDIGVKLMKEPAENKPPALVLPQEILDFVVTVPKILERIAVKLESFQDFSNVFAEVEEADDRDMVCPKCGEDTGLFERVVLVDDDDESDTTNFYCIRCAMSFDELVEADISKGDDDGGEPKPETKGKCCKIGETCAESV